MSLRTFLVFGDLHGRILHAFKLAAVWAREHETHLDGLLQVGDLGYFPDLSRLDKATRRHAAGDSTELGAQDIVTQNPLADEVFADPDCPPTLWFTAGNHEDHDALTDCANAAGQQTDCVVDAYCKVRCIKDGRILAIDNGPSVGALWGVDGDSANCRKNLPERGYIRQRSADQLLAEPFDVLLTHDAPLDAKRIGYGSETIAAVIGLAQPAFAFFGHYHGQGSRAPADFGRTEVYHLSGMELSGRNGNAEPGSVGVLTWSDNFRRFEFLNEEWLRTFTRHNWRWR
jgi:hypothetical protein